MSITNYEIPYFVGLNQANDENRLSPVYSPDAVNMDTDGGRLRVANGFVRYSDAVIPGTGRIDLLTSLHTADREIPVVITEDKLYAHIENEWVLKYTYNPVSSGANYDSTMVRIDSTDYLVIADGKHQMIKFDGETVSLFGSREQCSNVCTAYLTMYRGRLFAAGDPENPDRLYYSVLPGSGRTVENWGYIEASPAVEGGHAEVGSTGGDPIVAIRALSNQLLIFKKNSIYRLIGDRPSNFTIERIDASVLKTRHTAIAIHGDILYFVTQNGLYYYNGVTARPCPDTRLIRRYMSTANISRSRAAVVRDKLYFTYKRGVSDEIMVYDLMERRYMRRNGFSISDIANIDGRLHIVNRKRLLYIFGYGSDYDGESIKAYWQTPATDLGEKGVIKCPKRLYVRGDGGPFTIETELDGVRNSYTRRFKTGGGMLEIPCINEGRLMTLRISNENGSAFSLEGGLELEMGVRRRTE